VQVLGLMCHYSATLRQGINSWPTMPRPASCLRQFGIVLN
jgi:hypothetical protein